MQADPVLSSRIYIFKEQALRREREQTRQIINRSGESLLLKGYGIENPI